MRKRTLASAGDTEAWRPGAKWRHGGKAQAHTCFGARPLTMGQKASKGQPPSPGGKVTRYPVRFGRDDADARGTVYGVFYNLYSARPSVIAVNCIGAEAFNPRTGAARVRGPPPAADPRWAHARALTHAAPAAPRSRLAFPADRRGRRMLESPVVSCAFHPRSSFGPSVLLGTTDGRVTSVELNSLTCVAPSRRSSPRSPPPAPRPGALRCVRLHGAHSSPSLPSVSASVPTASAAPRGGADTPASEGDDAGHGAAGKAPVAAPEANPSLPAAASPLTRAGTTLPSAVTAICPVSSTHFAAGHGNGYVALFDVVSGDLVHAMELPEASTMDDAPPSAAAAASSAGTRVTCMAHAPETGVLAVGHANGHVHLFDTASGQWTRELPHSAPPSAIAFLPAYNALLAVVGISNRLSLWRLGEGQGAAPLSYDFTRELEAVKCTSSTAITAIAFDNARHILITGSCVPPPGPHPQVPAAPLTPLLSSQRRRPLLRAPAGASGGPRRDRHAPPALRARAQQGGPRRQVRPPRRSGGYRALVRTARSAVRPRGEGR